MPESNSTAILADLLVIGIFLNILSFKQGNHPKFTFISSLSLSFPRHEKQVEFHPTADFSLGPWPSLNGTLYGILWLNLSLSVVFFSLYFQTGQFTRG